MKNTKSNPIRPFTRRAARAAGIASATIIVMANSAAFAGAFTPGDLVVERLGNGTETLGTTGNSIFFDEYTPGGTFVQTIAIPDGANTPGANPMLEAGTGGTTGSISLSPDGQTLVFPGYATNLPNTVTITSAASTAVPRAIGSLNGAGVYSMAASNKLAFSGSNIRGAAADGENNFWAAGTASSTTVNAGVFYFGTVNPAIDVFTDNLRGVRVFNGTLWFTSASSSPGDGIWAFTGQPTGAATPTEIVTFGANDSDYNFAVSPDGTVIYDADDGGFSTTFSGIHKWTGSGTNFTLSYILLNNGPSGTGQNQTATGTECFGLTVDWTTTPPTLYATTANTSTTNQLIMVQDNGPTTNFTKLATAAAKEFFRGVAFVPTNAVGTLPPQVTGIFPASVTVDAGGTANLSVSAIGAAPLSYYWYQLVGSSSTLVPTSTTNTLTLNNLFGANAGSYYAVVSNASGLTSTSAVVPISVIDPYIQVEPANLEGVVGGSVQFDVTALGTGLAYQWYYSDAAGDPSTFSLVSPGTLADNSIIGAVTNKTLTWSNLATTDAPTNFVVVVTGTYGMVTSTVGTLEVVNTTNTLQTSPDAPAGFPGFNIILGFWDFNGPTFNNVTPPPFIGDGTASLVNLPPLTTTVSDPEDGAGTPFPYGQDLPNGAWGTSSYPASGSNMECGIQFNVSTAGSRNITVLYDSRVSATASGFEHLQYTIDGINWSNYPAASTFAGHSGTGNGGFIPFGYNLAGFPGVDNNPSFGVRVVTEFQSTATYGAGTRALVTNNYVGTANTYGTSGTVTYDAVQIAGDDIADTFTVPTVSCSFPSTNLFNNAPATNTLDNSPITVNLTVGSADMPPEDLTLSATVLGQVNQNNPPPTANATFVFGGTGANRTMTINPQPINDAADAAPVLVTVTDTNGLVGVTWFYLTLTTQFPPPTNSLVNLASTNMLANSTLSIPFVAGTTNVPISDLTFSVSSDNNTLLASTNMVVTANPVTNSNPALTNLILVITPTVGQAGMAEFSVTVSDNDTLHNDPKSTTSTTVLQVRPNTNVVLIDYFGYDVGGSLDTVGAGLWGHLSGIDLQMQVNSAPVGGYTLVDCADNTENLQAALLGAPYATTSSTVLYSSFIVNMNPNNAVNGMPTGNGSYFMNYNDGTGATGDYESGVYATTNGAAPGMYRLGIENWSGNGTENLSAVPFFPQDLMPGSNYVVVTSLAVSSGFSTLWLDPISQTSPSVQDTVSAATANATLYAISDLEFRESSSENVPSSEAGIIAVSHLKVGTTFDSVFPAPHIQSVSTNVVVTWSDPTLGLLASTNSVAGPYVPVAGGTTPFTANTTNTAVYYILGQ